MKENKRSLFFIFTILVVFLYVFNWGGSYLLSKIPSNLSVGKSFNIQGNPIRGFAVSGNVFLDDFEFFMNEPIQISGPFFSISEFIQIENCLMKMSLNDFSIFNTASAIQSMKIKSNNCQIKIELPEEIQKKTDFEVLTAQLNGDWDVVDESGYAELVFDQGENIQAWFQNGHAVGLKANIEKTSPWWLFLGLDPGFGHLYVDWDFDDSETPNQQGRFVLSDLNSGLFDDVEIIGSIYEDGDWSASVPIGPNGFIGLKSNNNYLDGNWVGVDWGILLNSKYLLANVLLGEEGRFSISDGAMILSPEKGEYFHQIDITKSIGRLMNKNSQSFEGFEWVFSKSGSLNITFQDFSWLLPRIFTWWPRGIFNGSLEMSTNGFIFGDIQIDGPAKMNLMNIDVDLDLFENSFEIKDDGTYVSSSLLLKFSDPPLVLVAKDLTASVEGGVFATGKIATKSDAIVQFFGTEVKSLLALFAGSDYDEQIFQIPVEITGSLDDPKISMSEMPTRWTICRELSLLDCLEKRAKQNPN